MADLEVHVLKNVLDLCTILSGFFKSIFKRLKFLYTGLCPVTCCFLSFLETK